MSDFNSRLNSFVEGCQAIVNKHYEIYDNLDAPTLTFTSGRRYVKLITDHKVGGKSVYCFVDKTNGNVLKAAGWSAPAKHARGNLYKDDNGLSTMSPFGAAYL